MGNSSSNENSLPPLEDDDESDNSENLITTDAALNSIPSSNVIKLNNVLHIEKQLDTHELVSLVFLLYDKAHLALQELELICNRSQKSLIYNWAVHELKTDQNWQRKLIEALTIIQNYEILTYYGFNKAELKTYYLPHQYFTSVYVNKTRKAIYSVCEKLTIDLSNKFLNRVKDDFKRKQLTFRQYNVEYMEMYFLYWEMIDYVKRNDFSNIKAIFKTVENSDKICEIFDFISKANLKSNNLKSEENGQNYNDSQMAHCSQTEPTNSFIVDKKNHKTNSDGVKIHYCENERYIMNAEAPGICLIINQKTFYREFLKKQYENDLPDDPNVEFEEREGTDKDKDRLIRTFTDFGFKVIVFNNLTHFDMRIKIEETVKSIKDECSLFVCILSHGDRDIVYGVNSCKMRVTEIQQIMCKSNRKCLENKPKVLILQSCQGTQCQKNNDSDDDNDTTYTTDGNLGNKKRPSTSDLLTFWATVPGFAAIRNKVSGTWFIQSLCNKMREKGNSYHFADICTGIVAEVSNKVWCQKNNAYVMQPIIHSTFTKYLFLPPMKTNQN